MHRQQHWQVNLGVFGSHSSSHRGKRKEEIVSWKGSGVLLGKSGYLVPSLTRLRETDKKRGKGVLGQCGCPKWVLGRHVPTVPFPREGKATHIESRSPPQPNPQSTHTVPSFRGGPRAAAVPPLPGCFPITHPRTTVKSARQKQERHKTAVARHPLPAFPCFAPLASSAVIFPFPLLHLIQSSSATRPL